MLIRIIFQMKKKMFNVVLVACPHLKCSLITINNKPKIITTVNGKPSYLRKVYVSTKESWVGLPKVLYFDVIGFDIENGEPIGMRITPKKIIKIQFF